MPSSQIRFVVLACLLSAGLLTTAVADDWPRWMGPQGDGVWRESGIVSSFPESGPTVTWRVPINGGYTGPAVAGDRVYVTDWIKDETDEAEGDTPRRGIAEKRFGAIRIRQPTKCHMTAVPAQRHWSRTIASIRLAPWDN